MYTKSYEQSNYFTLSPKSQPDSLNKRSPKKQFKKLFHKQRKQRNQMRNQLKQPLIQIDSIIKKQNKRYKKQTQRPNSMNISSIISNQNGLQSPQQYLKVNKLWRVTNQITSLDDINENQQDKIKNIFKPQQNFIIGLNLATIFVIYLYFTEIPISIAFENHRQEQDTRRIFQIINIPALIVFIAGAIIKLRTAYYSYGILITDTTKIMGNYLKKDFVIDLLSISSIIIYQISEIYHQGPISYRFIILLFYLKIGELVTMEKYLINFFDMNRRVKAFLKLSLLLAKIFLLCNIVACGFFYLSDNLCNVGKIYENCQQCCWTTSVTFDGDPIINSKNWNLQYVFSLYWASTTMISIGYGDVTPKNIYEIGYTIFVQFLSCLLYAYSINEIWQIIRQLNNKKQQIRHRLTTINTYCRDKKVSKDLKSKINAYLLNFYYTRNVRDKDLQNEIIQDLTPSLKTDLYLQAYGFIFNNHLFFKNFSSFTLQLLSHKIIESSYFQQEVVYSPFQQQIFNSLYYIQQGQAQNHIQLIKCKILIKKIYINQIAGLKQFITQLNYKSSLVINKFTIIYKLSFQDWKQCLREQDQDFQKFCQIKDKILKQKNLEDLNQMCQFCRQLTHSTQQCFHYQMNQKTHKFLKRYKLKGERKSFKRQNRISKHIFSNQIIKEDKNNQFRLRKNRSKNDLYQQNFRNPRKVSLEFIPIQNRKDTSEIDKNQLNNSINLRNRKKILNRKQTQHKEYINAIKNRFQQQGQDIDDLYSQDSQMILLTDYGIDKVQNYEFYYATYNANAEDQIKITNPRKRQTVMFKNFN